LPLGLFFLSAATSINVFITSLTTIVLIGEEKLRLDRFYSGIFISIHGFSNLNAQLVLAIYKLALDYLTLGGVIGKHLLGLDHDGHGQFVGRRQLKVDPVALFRDHQRLDGLVQYSDTCLNSLRKGRGNESLNAYSILDKFIFEALLAISIHEEVKAMDHV
jgi:hypothetical protein